MVLSLTNLAGQPSSKASDEDNFENDEKNASQSGAFF
jgi:hypothetical protein